MSHMSAPLILRRAASASHDTPKFVQATPLAKESGEVQLLDSQRINMGPVAGPYSGADVTKSLNFALPPGATADISRVGAAAAAAAPPVGVRAASLGMPASAGAPAPGFTDAMRQALRADTGS